MKKRWIVITSIVLSILIVALAGGFTWVTLAAKKDNGIVMDFNDRNPDDLIKEITSNYEEISEEEGVVYLNNELILIVKYGVSDEQVESLAMFYDAEISDYSMAKYGIYKIMLNGKSSLQTLENIAESMRNEEIVESVEINYVSFTGNDLIPNDEWNGASWDISNPAGENWGMEAIRAPQAWDYLDEVGTANVGLIDSMVDMNHTDLNIDGAYYSDYDEDSKKWNAIEINNSDIVADDHGTHVAGIMSAIWDKDGCSGITAGKQRLYYSRAIQYENGEMPDCFTTPYAYVQAISVLLDRDVQAINISQNTNRLIAFAASYGDEAALKYLQLQADTAEKLLKRIIESRTREQKSDFVICVAAGNVNHLKYCKDDNNTYGYRTYDENIDDEDDILTGGVLAKYNNYLNLIDESSVLSRIIVVGAIELSNEKNPDIKYEYAYFSNVGDRVDVVAPGVDIYSCVPTTFEATGFDLMSGTSMAAPHVTGVAGMLFATNTKLSGPEVKAIICASGSEKFYYQGGSSGLLDFEKAIKSAVESRDTSVNRVVSQNISNKLDICFLVDTTGSMDDDIDNARENMVEILDVIEDQTPDFRIALVEYRDFAERTYYSYDYPAKTQLNFSPIRDEIINAIENLDLGNGGDTKETVYSGFAEALRLDWRFDANKAIIVLGDAPPLDPEPYTGYTYDRIVEALYNADIAVDIENSDDRVLGDAKDSLIKIYTIGTGENSDALEFFESISSDTGGTMSDVTDASGVSDAIVESIEKIEISPKQTVKFDLGEEFSNETINVYEGSTYFFSVKLDDTGSFTMSNMDINSYNWEIERLHRGGTFKVKEGNDKASVNMEDPTIMSFFATTWHRHRTTAFVWIEGVLVCLLLLLIGVYKLITFTEKRRVAVVDVPIEQRVVMTQSPTQETSVVQRSVVDSAQEEKIIYCAYCGKKMNPQNRFCGVCGKERKQF